MYRQYYRISQNFFYLLRYPFIFIFFIGLIILQPNEQKPLKHNLLFIEVYFIHYQPSYKPMNILNGKGTIPLKYQVSYLANLGRLM